MNEETTMKRGAGRLVHNITCLCAQCTELYNYHINVLHGQARADWCEFCQDHQYALARTERAVREPDGGKNIMSTINICTRCETMTLGRAMGEVQYYTKPGMVWKPVELCPGCVEEFLLWLSSDPITERPKVYKEPYMERPKSEETEVDPRLLLSLLEKATRVLDRALPAGEAATVVDGEAANETAMMDRREES